MAVTPARPGRNCFWTPFGRPEGGVNRPLWRWLSIEVSYKLSTLLSDIGLK